MEMRLAGTALPGAYSDQWDDSIKGVMGERREPAAIRLCRLYHRDSDNS